MADLLPAPRQHELDALFARSSRARVLVGGAVSGKPLGSLELVSFGRDELGLLRDALRVAEEAPPFHCLCRGDFAVELRGRFFRVATLSYHHGRSVRLADERWDAELVDGPALLRLLAERGTTWPLERYEAALRAGLRADDAHARFLLACPAELRPMLDRLEHGPMGLPPVDSAPIFDEALSALRATGEPESRIAERLLAWLGSSDGPWSGHAAVENVPLVLLRRLDELGLREALTEASDEDALLGAARLVADHQVVTFRKRLVSSIPEARFSVFAERLGRVPLTSEEREDAERRLEAARRVGEDARTREGRLASERDRELAWVATSEDGPFGCLATDGRRLAAVDVYRVVLVDPSSGSLTHLTTYQGSPFTELAFAGGELYALRSNEGRVDRIALDGSGRTTLVEGLARPLDLRAAGDGLAFVSAPFAPREVEGRIAAAPHPSIATLDPDGTVCSVVAVERGVSTLACDETHLYFATTDLERRGHLFRVPRDGGEVHEVVELAGLGHAMAKPALFFLADSIVFAADDRIHRVPRAGGRGEILHRLGCRVAALGQVGDAIVAIVGDASDDEWDVWRLPLNGKGRTIGTLRRAPYHRLDLVSVEGGAVYFTLDDRLYRVR